MSVTGDLLGGSAVEPQILPVMNPSDSVIALPTAPIIQTLAALISPLGPVYGNGASSPATQRPAGAAGTLAHRDRVARPVQNIRDPSRIIDPENASLVGGHRGSKAGTRHRLGLLSKHSRSLPTACRWANRRAQIAEYLTIRP